MVVYTTRTQRTSFVSERQGPSRKPGSHRSVHFNVGRPRTHEETVKPGCACELLRSIAIFYAAVERFETFDTLKTQ